MAVLHSHRCTNQPAILRNDCQATLSKEAAAAATRRRLKVGRSPDFHMPKDTQITSARSPLTVLNGPRRVLPLSETEPSVGGRFPEPFQRGDAVESANLKLGSRHNDLFAERQR